MGYMSDKFNIPVANLTKENVREELHKRGAAPEDTQLSRNSSPAATKPNIRRWLRPV